MNKQIRTGVIGVGNMGQHHARIYASLPGSTLIGVADTNATRAEAIASRYDVRPFSDYQRLLDEVEAVTVAAPTTLHHQIGMECLRRGVHILMEKPLAASVVDAHALDDLAVPSGLVLQVGHVERFNPTFVELVNVLRDHKGCARGRRNLRDKVEKRRRAARRARDRYNVRRGSPLRRWRHRLDAEGHPRAR